MALVLQPSLDEHTREEIEAHVQVVQARRMVAAIEYMQGVAERIEDSTNKLSGQLSQHYTQLNKEIQRLDRALAAVESRLVKIAEVQHEYHQQMQYGESIKGGAP
jgi:cell shape-determining protein MreC